MNGARVANINQGGINQRTRIWAPREIVLAQMFSGDTVLPATVIPFVVPTPDARVQVNVSILAVPDPTLPGLAIPYDVTGAGAVTPRLWLAAAAIPQAWGGLLPVTNLVGTHAAPQAIPFDPGLMAYAQTVLADCDAVYGELTMAQAGGESGGAPNTTWILKTRYQPVAGALICDEEWSEIVSKCSPSIRGNPLILVPSL